MPSQAFLMHLAKQRAKRHQRKDVPHIHGTRAAIESRLADVERWLDVENMRHVLEVGLESMRGYR